MTTLADLVEDALAILRGYVVMQDESTHLTAAVDDNDLVWSVGNASRLSGGRCSVDDEVVYIDSFDTTNNTITIAPYGRGMDGSVADDHASLAQVTGNAKFPRHWVKRAINDTLRAVASVGLFAVSSEVFSTESNVTSYELPIEARHVIDVQYEESDNKWIQLRNWRMENSASTGTHSTGKAIVTGLLPGDRQLEVTYALDPSVLDADADDFATTTGLPDSCAEVIVFGACWRLLSSVGPGRLDAASISAADLDGKGGAQPEASESLQMYRSFNQRLGEERSRLLNRYNTPIHNVRF